MDLLCRQVSEAVEEGYEILVLSDRGVDIEHAPIPSLLAVSGVHHHLIREGMRTKVGLVVETGEAREVAHFALLFGYGAAAINPYLAYETIAGTTTANPSGISYEEAEENFVHAVHKGVVKVMSKMGISTLQGYRGAQVFEAVGLRQEMVDRYFTWTPSRIGGIGIGEIEAESRRRHTLAYQRSCRQRMDAGLRLGGQYQWRHDGEFHMWNPDTIASLQHATRTNSFATFKQFAEYADGETRRLCTIRGLLRLKKGEEPVSLDEVEPASEIVKAVRYRGHLTGINQPRSPRDDGDRHEPNRRPEQHRGGW